MIYAQYYINSTGYVNDGTMRFCKKNVKPIELLGTDGVRPLDGRLSISNMVNEVDAAITKHIKSKSIVGYKIMRAERFSSSNQSVLYSNI